MTDGPGDPPSLHSLESEGVAMAESADWTDAARAFALFYEQAKGPVFRAMLVITDDRGHAEDATATAFMRAWQRWEEVVDYANPKAWVLRVARNEHRSSWRHWERRRVFDVPDTPQLQVRNSIDPQLVQMIRALPRRQREVIALRDLVGFTTDETAEFLGISPSTVTVHLHRAHRTLRAALGEGWETEGRDG